jgi:hypothetical protein
LACVDRNGALQRMPAELLRMCGDGYVAPSS